MHFKLSSSLLRLVLIVFLLNVPSAFAETPADPFSNLSFRNIGPVNMSGRVADVEGVPGDPRIVYVGSASGGIWKSRDGGLTFAPIFDDQNVASIGDLALAPSQADVLYAGTGEANVRNSVSIGNGVYKSTDGGTTWTHLGLEKTRHISRMAVHPRDPDVVWVGALGSIYGPSEDRGVFKSDDGGKTWRKTLYLDERHGVADLDVDPTNPKILFAALWHFERKPWTIHSGGSEGGLWRSLDGGESWEKVGEGLPKEMGRIGVKIAPSRPETVYVIAESNDGILFRSDDRGKTFRQVNDDVTLVSRGFYYTDLRVDPTDENRVYAIASRLYRSIDGGKNFERIARRVHIDFHSLWIDPLDPNRMWVGEDGGVAVSYDRGDVWEPLLNLPVAQFYQVFYDMKEPFYRLGGGLQDNGAWYGPSRTREPAGILSDDWRMMSFGDAYFIVPHPTDENLFLSEYQAGGILRTDIRTRQQVDVNPQARRNDGGPAGELDVRFNWNAPIIASPHDPNTVYFAGSVVFKTRDFGDTWEAISPDLTTNDPEKIGEAGGPIWPENTTAEYHCTIISFAESPVEAGLLWVGTDDGNLQISRDAGETWTNLITNVPGVPASSPVSHIEPSRQDAGTAWASFDRHMFDDYAPHIFRTDDYGATWKRVSSEGIHEDGWVWALRQDPKNPELLWAGTEFGLYAKRGGAPWVRMHLENLPTVAVHDVLFHPRENDLILGTHGRAIWVFDDAAPLQEWSDEIADRNAHLFTVRPALRFPTRFTRYGLGDKAHVAPNPPAGALITYHLKESLTSEGQAPEDEAETANEDAADRIRLEIFDAAGVLVRTIEADELKQTAGLHRIAWDLRHDPPRPRTDEKQGPSEFGGGPAGPQVLPGVYNLRLTVDDESYEQSVEVRVDPLVPVDDAALRAQHAASSELVELQSRVNGALRAFDVLKAQIEASRATWKTLGGASDEVEAAWDEYEEKIADGLRPFVREEGKPYWSQGPKIENRLSDLFGLIDAGFAAPTAAQKEYFVELREETKEALAAAHEVLTTDLAACNDVLSAGGAAKLVVSPK